MASVEALMRECLSRIGHMFLKSDSTGFGMTEAQNSAQETGGDCPAEVMVHPRGQPPLSVAILLWPSFPLMSLACLVESLRHVGDHGDASQNRYTSWDILGGVGRAMRSSCGIKVDATAHYPDPEDYDYVFAIGGLLHNLDKAPAEHTAYLHRVHRLRRPLIGVCTGIFVLAQEGMLNGKSVCVHPYHGMDFRTRFPNCRPLPNRDFVTVESITTVLGGVSILPLMNRIIGDHLGPDRSAKIVHQMTLPAPDLTLTLQSPVTSDHGNITDPRIQEALVRLDAQAATNPSISGLAKSLGLSERHFLRLFQCQVGQSPKAYLVETKLRSAVWMLRNTRRSITEIAYAAGFSSGANLSDHCHKRLGMTPTQMRRLAREGAAS
ncbi:MAG: helix-turn-helix domain-containing protein [Pseudomonadota bacterium]